MKYLYCFLLFNIFACNIQKPMDKNTVPVSEFMNLDTALLNKEHVKSLILRNQGYTEIPVEIFQFSALETLDLSLNEIKTIPNELFELKNLTYLSLSYNSLNKIPENVKFLNNLETLQLLENNIAELPKSLCSLRKIKYINLTLNKVSDLPDCISSLKSLERIALETESEEPIISIKRQLELQRLLPTCEFFF